MVWGTRAEFVGESPPSGGSMIYPGSECTEININLGFHYQACSHSASGIMHELQFCGQEAGVEHTSQLSRLEGQPGIGLGY